MKRRASDAAAEEAGDEAPGRRPTKRSRATHGLYAVLLLAVVAVAVLLLTLDWELVAQPSRDAEETEAEGEAEKEPKNPPLLVEDIYGDLFHALDFLSALKFIHTSGVRVDARYFAECMADHDFFRAYTDPKCLVFWMHKLEFNPPQSIDMVLGVMTRDEEVELGKGAADKPMSNGGMRVTLSDARTQGYWKPCTLDTGHMETYVTEITSFVLDRLLGFFHTPPVVPRFFTATELNMLATMAEETRADWRDEEALRKVESVVRLCGQEDDVEKFQIAGAEGAMVGWSPFRVKNMYSKKRQENKFVKFEEVDSLQRLDEVKAEFFNVTNADQKTKEGKQAAVKAVEILAVHMYAMVVGNLHKFDHNLFAAVSKDGKTTGPFVYIDNDRSQWRWKFYRTKWIKEGINPMARICKFPTRIAHRILFYRTANTKNNNGYTLGRLMMALEQENVYENFINGPLWTPREATVLDANIDYMAAMIDRCVRLHGADQVFLDESWPQPDDSPSFYDVLQEVGISDRPQAGAAGGDVQ